MGWIIFGGIVLVIAALLALPAVVKVEYAEDVRVRVKLLFITIARVPPKTKKSAKKDKRAKKAAEDIAKAEADALNEGAADSAQQGGISKSAENAAPKSSTADSKAGKAKSKAAAKSPQNSKLTLDELLELVKSLVDSLGKPLKRLLHRTRIEKLRIDIICGGEDAADAALNFGKTNILVGNILGWIDAFFTLKKPDDIHIDVDFQREESAYKLSFTARLTVFAALAFLLTALGRAVGHYRKKPVLQRALQKLK